jgi:hypothetical protein
MTQSLRCAVRPAGKQHYNPSCPLLVLQLLQQPHYQLLLCLLHNSANSIVSTEGGWRVSLLSQPWELAFSYGRFHSAPSELHIWNSPVVQLTKAVHMPSISSLHRSGLHGVHCRSEMQYFQSKPQMHNNKDSTQSARRHGKGTISCAAAVLQQLLMNDEWIKLTLPSP